MKIRAQMYVFMKGGDCHQAEHIDQETELSFDEFKKEFLDHFAMLDNSFLVFNKYDDFSIGVPFADIKHIEFSFEVLESDNG